MAIISHSAFAMTCLTLLFYHSLGEQIEFGKSRQVQFCYSGGVSEELMSTSKDIYLLISAINSGVINYKKYCNDDRPKTVEWGMFCPDNGGAASSLHSVAVQFSFDWSTRFIGYCKGGFGYGVVLHEVMHSMGIKHTMCSDDFDKLINIKESCITDSSQFVCDNGADIIPGMVDTLSIMNYNSLSFLKEGCLSTMNWGRGGEQV